MNAREFFNEVKKKYDETEGSDPVGVAFFIGDMEQLFEKWEEEGEKR